MNNLDGFLQRNKEFAAQQAAKGGLIPSLPPALPNVRAVIIGCADMRVDPSHVLGIKPGEAVVIRNIGGRIAPLRVDQSVICYPGCPIAAQTARGRVGLPGSAG